MQSPLKKWSRALRSVTVSASLCLLGAASVGAADDRISLSSAVFFGTPTIKEMLRKKSHGKNDCLEQYLKAIPTGSFLLSAVLPSGQEKTREYRRRHLEEQMIVLFGAEVQKEAHAFARAVPLCLEWEGMTEGPLGEVEFTDAWLKSHPGTRIDAFLYLFTAHRLRAAFEAANRGKDHDLRPLLAARYKEALGRAKSFHHPLISCIAEDMEAEDHVYLKGCGKP